MNMKSFLRLLPITLIVIIIIFTAKAGFSINNGLKELTTYHSPTLITMQQMESDMFEAVQEAFSYVLLNDEVEKEEFYEKSADFDLVAQAFQEIARFQDEERVAEEEAFTEVIDAKGVFFANAEKMMNDFERLGYAPRQSVIATEDSIDRLTVALNHLVDVEKQELDEHVAELERMVLWEIKLLLILSIFLLIVLLRRRRLE